MILTTSCPDWKLGTLRAHIDQKSVSLRAIYHAYHANDIWPSRTVRLWATSRVLPSRAALLGTWGGRNGISLLLLDKVI